MATDVNGFLLSLAVAISGLTSLSIATTPRRIGAGQIDETDAAAEFTVLRIYGFDENASFAGSRFPVVRVQADTRGKDGDAAFVQAMTIHESLIDSQDRPRMHWMIAGKKLVGGAIVADTTALTPNWEIRTVRFITAPQVVDRNEDNRVKVTSNFEVDFQRAA